MRAIRTHLWVKSLCLRHKVTRFWGQDVSMIAQRKMGHDEEPIGEWAAHTQPRTFPSFPLVSLHSPLHIPPPQHLSWKQADPCVIVKSSHLSQLCCYYMPLFGFIVTYCPLAFCQLALHWQFRSRPERLSHGRVTGSGAAPYNIVFLARPGDFIVSREPEKKPHKNPPNGARGR